MHIFNEESSNLIAAIVKTVLEVITGNLIVWPHNYRNSTKCISKCIENLLITSCEMAPLNTRCSAEVIWKRFHEGMHLNYIPTLS